MEVSVTHVGFIEAQSLAQGVVDRSNVLGDIVAGDDAPAAVFLNTCQGCVTGGVEGMNMNH